MLSSTPDAPSVMEDLLNVQRDTLDPSVKKDQEPTIFKLEQRAVRPDLLVPPELNVVHLVVHLETHAHPELHVSLRREKRDLPVLLVPLRELNRKEVDLHPVVRPNPRQAALNSFLPPTWELTTSILIVLPTHALLATSSKSKKCLQCLLCHHTAASSWAWSKISMPCSMILLTSMT